MLLMNKFELLVVKIVLRLNLFKCLEVKIVEFNCFLIKVVIICW